MASRLKAEKIRVAGRVQDVGYKRFVQEIARRSRLTGNVRNEPDASVTIFVQGASDALEEFTRALRLPPRPAEVAEVTRSPARNKKGLKYFEVVFRGTAEELQDGFGAMQGVFNDFRQDFDTFHGEFRDYRHEFKDYRQEFRGFGERTDQNFKLLGDKYGEISAKLSSILETLQRESAETRADLKRSVDNLSRLVDEYIARGKQ